MKPPPKDPAKLAALPIFSRIRRREVTAKDRRTQNIPAGVRFMDEFVVEDSPIVPLFTPGDVATFLHEGCYWRLMVHQGKWHREYVP